MEFEKINFQWTEQSSHEDFLSMMIYNVVKKHTFYFSEDNAIRSVGHWKNGALSLTTKHPLQVWNKRRSLNGKRLKIGYIEVRLRS